MTSGNFAKDRLKSFVERIENLNEEVDALKADIKEVFGEAKGEGFSVKILRQVIKLRKMDTADRQEQFALIDLYMDALGMTPIEAQIAALRESEAAAPDVDPPYLVRALDLVEEKGQGKLTARDVAKEVGVIEVVKAKGARGALGSAFDLVDTVLVGAGFESLGKSRYRAPAGLMDAPAPEDGDGEG